jgi:DNA primase catalytic subunit
MNGESPCLHNYRPRRINQADDKGGLRVRIDHANIYRRRLTTSPSAPQVMNAFYRRLFPYRPFFLWLNQDHGKSSPAVDAAACSRSVPAKLFTHREFAFTLPGDVYIRYNSFHAADDFKKELVRLNPSRFEIGPQYSARVSTIRSRSSCWG